MQDKRQLTTHIIGEDNLKKLDEANLVVVLRDERDQLQTTINTLTSKIETLEAKDDKTALISEITKVLETSEEHIVSKIHQLRQALRPFAALSNKVPPDYSLVINARVVLGDKSEIVVTEQNVKNERRESVYIPKGRSISTNKNIGGPVLRRAPVPTVVVKPKKTTLGRFSGDARSAL